MSKDKTEDDPLSIINASGGANRGAERTVFVVNAQALPDFLKDFRFIDRQSRRFGGP
jgi:hypothetical protein